MLIEKVKTNLFKLVMWHISSRSPIDTHHWVYISMWNYTQVLWAFQSNWTNWEYHIQTAPTRRVSAAPHIPCQPAQDTPWTSGHSLSSCPISECWWRNTDGAWSCAREKAHSQATGCNQHLSCSLADKMGQSTGGSRQAATWEDSAFVQKVFPSFQPWGQVLSHLGGIVIVRPCSEVNWRYPLLFELSGPVLKLTEDIHFYCSLAW